MAAITVIDPAGTVILVVRNPDPPFAIMERDVQPSPNTAPPVCSSTAQSPESTETGNPHTPAELRFRVSAKCLAHASSVFDKMLNGDWKESHELMLNGTIEIPVQDCSVDALRLILHICHGQFDEVPYALDVEMVAKFAVIADYYNFQHMRFFTRLWLPEFDCWNDDDAGFENNDMRTILMVLWIRYFSQQPKGFEFVTSVAMGRSCGRVSALGLPIPGRIIDEMNERRINKIRDHFQTLRGFRQTLLNDDTDDKNTCTFKCRSLTLGALMKQAHNLHLSDPEPTPPFENLKYRTFGYLADIDERWAEYVPEEGPNKEDKYTYCDHECRKFNYGGIAAYFESFTSIEGLSLETYIA
ncbi:hypothetical protein BJY04DRAFT_217829 [Aspergillus karnatakaensis]|uniref:BTB/POZ domain-containing protein n=1 Tax=Aspergillus karnatakaensis TaxID=1810916 RepID=UPI003CCDDFCD